MGRRTERSTGGTSGKSGNKRQRGCAANDSKLPRPRHLSPPATGATAATPSSESRLLSLGVYYDLSGAESACLFEEPGLVCRPGMECERCHSGEPPQPEGIFCGSF